MNLNRRNFITSSKTSRRFHPTTCRAHVNSSSPTLTPMPTTLDSAPNFSTSFQGIWSEDGYILFDLQSEQEIFGTRMYNYAWPYQYCINQEWSVYTSSDGENWTKQTTDSIDCSLFTASVDYVKSVTEGKPDGSDFPEPVKARYVKLVIDKVFVGCF